MRVDCKRYLSSPPFSSPSPPRAILPPPPSPLSLSCAFSLFLSPTLHLLILIPSPPSLRFKMDFDCAGLIDFTTPTTATHGQDMVRAAQNPVVSSGTYPSHSSYSFQSLISTRKNLEWTTGTSTFQTLSGTLPRTPPFSPTPISSSISISRSSLLQPPPKKGLQCPLFLTCPLQICP